MSIDYASYRHSRGQNSSPAGIRRRDDDLLVRSELRRRARSPVVRGPIRSHVSRRCRLNVAAVLSLVSLALNSTATDWYAQR